MLYRISDTQLQNLDKGRVPTLGLRRDKTLTAAVSENGKAGIKKLAKENGLSVGELLELLGTGCFEITRKAS